MGSNSVSRNLSWWIRFRLRRRLALGWGRVPQCLSIKRIGFGLFALLSRSFCRVEMKMLLQSRLEVLELRIAYASAVREEDFSGGNGGNRHVAIDLGTHFEHKKLLLSRFQQISGCEESAHQKDS